MLITHKLKEIMAVTDFVSVMRGGEMVDHLKTKDTTPQQLAELMVGRPVLLDVGYAAAEPGQPVLTAEHLTVTGASGVPHVRDLSFTVHQGEILGIAGVSGNGQSELLDVLAGIRQVTSGQSSWAADRLQLTSPPPRLRSRLWAWLMSLKTGMRWA